MEIKVSLDDFPEAVSRLAPNALVTVSETDEGISAWALNPSTKDVILTNGNSSLEFFTARLTSQGLRIRMGKPHNIYDSVEAESSSIWVAAVAYRSRELRPGVWVDAFPHEPTQLEVLRAMYDDFRETGDTKEVDFDEFCRLSMANVIIVSPHNLTAFARRKGI